MGTSCARHSAGELYKRGEGYDIPGERVDGMNVITVQEAARKAIDYVRSGKGPYILEVMTYRFRGHSMSDPANYRSKEELDEYKKIDPIEQIKELLRGEGVSDEDMKAMDKTIRAQIADAAAFAQESPELPAEELWTDVLL